jgi:EAL domain-containing protein (putative c-di-GMP-specific phosphodiesterase class I)
MSDERLLEFIRQELSAVDVPAECICFEITETAAVQNLATASQFIQELKDLGCRFALDDFGSGLSSFMYLKHLPVDFLKIDGSFVRDMQDNAMNRAIVEACHQIGRTIGVRTIAEFVEDRSTLDALHAIGVDFAQGYGISKPRPLDDFLAENARN